LTSIFERVLNNLSDANIIRLLYSEKSESKEERVDWKKPFDGMKKMTGRSGWLAGRGCLSDTLATGKSLGVYRSSCPTSDVFKQLNPTSWLFLEGMNEESR